MEFFYKENEIEPSSLDRISSSYVTNNELKNAVKGTDVETNSFEEMVNTFTAELAHTAYLSISRLNSGYVKYINSCLK
jgi:hypothetical protein